MSEITTILKALGNTKIPLGKLFRTLNPKLKPEAVKNFNSDVQDLESAGVLIDRKNNSESTIRVSESAIGIEV